MRRSVGDAPPHRHNSSLPRHHTPVGAGGAPGALAFWATVAVTGAVVVAGVFNAGSDFAGCSARVAANAVDAEGGSPRGRSSARTWLTTLPVLHAMPTSSRILIVASAVGCGKMPRRMPMT